MLRIIKKYISKINNSSLSNLEKELCNLKNDNNYNNINTKKLINDRIDMLEMSLKTSFRDIHNHINLDIRTSNYLTRFSLRKNKNRIKIIFLINNIDAWISICDVIQKARDSDRFDVTLCSIHKKFPGETDYGGEEKVHNFLYEKKIPHIRLNMKDSWAALDIIRALNPDVLLRQSQWDDDYDVGLRSDVLMFTRLAYISYELVNQTENVRSNDDVIDSAIDSHWHRRCWRVYCANNLVKEQAYKNGKMQGKQFVVTGHPKVEYILHAEPRWPFKDTNEKRKKLVWSAHHTIKTGWSSFGMFHIIWKDMLEWAKSDSDIDFVFSPHPALLTVLQSDNIPISKEDVDLFFLEWNKLENTYTFWGGDYSGIMAASDVLLSDSLSMPTEYQLRNKPIVFLDRRDRIKFNKIGEIIEQGFHKCSNFQDAKNLVLRFLNGEKDPLKETQKKNMSFLFGERNSAKRILDDIFNGLMEEYIGIE